MTFRRYAIGAAGIAMAGLVIVGALKSWSPEAWGALAAWITAVVALAAGYVALGQLGEARAGRLEQARLRKEQAQPYVMAYIEFSEASTFLVDLVVRNFGATAAHNVALEIDPVPRRSIDEERQQQSGDSDGASDAGQPEEYVWLPAYFPVLVPGQEWRTLWDSGRRMETDLPDHHVATIRYTDSRGESYRVEAVLDWRMVKDREMVTVYGAHHAAEALRDIRKSIAKWKEGPAGGLAVYVRDGDAKDDRLRQLREARLADRQPRAEGENMEC